MNSFMKHIDQIEIDDHPFNLSLRKDTIRLYFTKSRKPRTKFNPLDTYKRANLEVSLRLLSIMETLALSSEFIQERRGISFNNKFKVNNSKYLRYHLECYWIRVTSYKDLILKLINRVYATGIKENIGLERNLVTYAEKNDLDDISYLLKGLNIIMSKIEPTRHRITHGNYHDDTDLILIESMEQGRSQKRRINRKTYRQALERFMSNNLVIMYLIELMMKSYLKLAFDTLYPIRIGKEREISKQKSERKPKI